MNEIEITIMGTDIIITNDNIHVDEAYLVWSPALMRVMIKKLREYLNMSDITMDTPLNYRSNSSLIREWITNNTLYNMYIMRSKTCSINFKKKQPWYKKVLDTLCSVSILFYH